MSEAKRIERFWSWFVANESLLFRNDSSQSDAIVAVHEQIERVHKGLGCKFGGVRNNPPELAITAYGNSRLFQLVDRIVFHAPVVGMWVFHALSPALSLSGCSWNGVWIDYKNIVVDVVRVDSKSAELNISVPLPDVLFDLKGEAESAAHSTVMNTLGERLTVLKVHSISARPIGIAGKGQAVPLSGLRDFVRSFDVK